MKVQTRELKAKGYLTHFLSRAMVVGSFNLIPYIHGFHSINWFTLVLSFLQDPNVKAIKALMASIDSACWRNFC